MKRLLVLLLVVVLLTTSGLVSPLFVLAADSSEIISGEYADDCVIVVIDKTHSKVNKLFTKNKFKGVSLENIEDLTYFEKDQTDNPYFDETEFHQILKLDLVKTGKDEVAKAIRKLEKLDFVISAQPNYYFELDSVEYSGEDNLQTAETDATYPWALTQTHIVQARTFISEYLSDTSSEPVKVGVIDTGIDADTDLNVNWDLARDFYGSENTTVTDGNVSHGTTVSNIIASANSNIGVCDNVEIVPLQAAININERPQIDSSAVCKAVVYAIENRIPVLNCSFGGYYTIDVAKVSFYKAMQCYDGLIVCGAGNDMKNTDVNLSYPSGLPLDNIISVAASKSDSVDLATEADWGTYIDEDGVLQFSGSNFGVQTVDIVAPGTDVYVSTNSSGYITSRGTSVAAPYVSGVAVLILSVCPGMTGKQLRAIILDSADEYPEELGDYIANGAFLNAEAAVNYALGYTIRVKCDPVGGLNSGVDSFYLKSGDSCKLDIVPYKVGYKFSGWKYGDTIYNVGDNISNVQDDITLTAQWEELFIVINYEVPTYGDFNTSKYYYSSYVSNGGIPSSFLWDSHDGYDLISWQDKESLTIYIPDSAGEFLDFKNYTLIGNAAPLAKGSVTYNSNGGEGGPQPQTVYYKDYTIISNETPTRDGYTFLGWALSPDGDVAYVPGSKYSTYNDHTIYAKWVSDGFVVRFNTGTTATDESQAYDPPVSVVYDTDATYITLPNEIPVREGRVFSHWSCTLGDTTTIYYPGERFILNSDVLSEYDLTGSNVVELTAVWQDSRTEYAMAFVDLPEHDGVTGQKWVRIVEAGETYGDCYVYGDEEKAYAFPADPVADGYIFDGWADAEGNIITADTVVSKDGFHYIYSRWIPIAAFTDIDESALEEISLCSWYGYMGGVGGNIFDPDSMVTRATAAVVLHRLAGTPKYGNNTFYDVNTLNSDGSSNLASEAITWITQNDILKPEACYYFDVNAGVTREQVVSMLFNYYRDYSGLALQQSSYTETGVADRFTDYDDITVGKVKYRWALAEGLIDRPADNLLEPQHIVTRGEFAEILNRFRRMLINEGGITTLKNGTTKEEADSIGYLEPVLGDNSWAQINAASEAGVADVIWNVGDTKAITLSTGEQVTMQIYGFNHDDITGGVKAGITFGLLKVMNGVKSMNNSNNNIGGYTETALYDWLTTDLYNSLPTELRAYMKNVDKKTSVGGGSAEIETDSMNVFLFSEYECCGWLHYSAAGEGQQYEIFVGQQGIQARQKHNPALGINEWWLRSPSVNGTTNFGIIHSTGSAGYTSASWPYAGVNFGLCI